jgi:hypothetical protein
MDARTGRWLSTEQIAERIGMTGEWVRRQVLAGRLKAVVFRTASRATYRVRETDLREFLSKWSVTHDRPEWEDFRTGLPVDPRTGPPTAPSARLGPGDSGREWRD